MATESEPLKSHFRGAWRRWAAVAIVLGVVVAALASRLLLGEPSTEKELAAKAELTELGALIVMDSQRKHVGSVNLSTLKSPETLDRAIGLLPALKNIKSLHLDGTQLADDEANVVGQLASLEDLVLNQTAITDSGLERLESLPRLKTLHLADTAVTSAGMQSLGRLRALAVVDLSGTKVTGNFEPLAELPDLTWLVAQRLSLDAAAIAALGECESLSRLSLNDATYPEDALKKLSDKRPNLAIDR